MFIISGFELYLVGCSCSIREKTDLEIQTSNILTPLREPHGYSVYMYSPFQTFYLALKILAVFQQKFKQFNCYIL